MRYQTSSIRRKAKPAIPAAINVIPSREDGEGSSSYLRCGSLASLGMTARFRATIPTSALSRTAINSVRMFPNVSSMKNVDSNVPVTAPRVLTPYSSETRRRPSSSLDSTARAAAGSVPPIRNVGIPRTRRASRSRAIVAKKSPSVTEPPTPK